MAVCRRPPPPGTLLLCLAAVGLHAANAADGQLNGTFVSGPNSDGMLADSWTAVATRKRLHVDAGHDGETLWDSETSARQPTFRKCPCGSNCCLLPPLAAPAAAAAAALRSRALLASSWCALSHHPFSFAPHPEAIFLLLSF